MSLFTMLSLITSINWLHHHQIFCLQQKMIFQVLSWAIQGSFLGNSPLNRGGFSPGNLSFIIGGSQTTTWNEKGKIIFVSYRIIFMLSLHDSFLYFYKTLKLQRECIYKTVSTLWKVLYITLTSYCFAQSSTFLPQKILVDVVDSGMCEGLQSSLKR